MIEVNRFGIEPVESYLGYIVIEILDKHKKELIAEFLERLNWICERVEFHTENPDSELLDELIEEYHKWEEKAK